MRGIGMFDLVSRVMASVARRTAVTLALALPTTAGLIIVVAVPQASACSDSNGANHCYSVGLNLNGNTNHGVYGEVDVHCLYQPNNGNFATNEIWDVSSGNPPNYWEEAGIISGVDPNSNYDNKNWFWADSRPNGGNFHFHLAPVKQANTDTAYPTEAEYAGGQTWNIFGANAFVQIGTSINQSATIIGAEGGTEYLGGSSSGIRDIGNIYNLQRKSSSNTWYSWGSNAFDSDSGPGHYTTGSYNGTTSHESWSGPC